MTYTYLALVTYARFRLREGAVKYSMAASPSTLAVIAYALYPQLLTVQAPIKRPVAVWVSVPRPV